MSKAILHYLFSNDDIKKIISKKPKKKKFESYSRKGKSVRVFKILSIITKGNKRT
jgi:hypothetical protein